MKWATKLFGEVVDILDSRRIPVNADERSKRAGEVPYYGATGRVGFIDDHLFDEELVLLGEDGAPFLDSAKPKAYMVRGKSWVNNHAHVLRGKPGLLNSFLLHQLNCVDYRPFISGTTRLKLPQGPMKRIPLVVPDEKEQRLIVAEIEKQFTRLDAGVAALRRVQANLKRYRAAVLKAACEGRLVPTEAELARKEGRTFETGEQLLQRIHTERRKNWNGRGKFKEPVTPDTTNLPQLPKGWAWATVEQLASPEPNSITDGPFGSNLKTEHYTDRGPRVIRLQNIGDGVYVDEEAHISPAHFERLQKHRVFANDVVIAGFGEAPPRACIIPEALGPAIVKADCIRFKPHSRVLSKYMIAALNSDPVRKRTKGMVHGVGRPRLNLGEIKSIALPLSPLAEQKRIVAEVERRLSVIEELETAATANLARATRLRQSVLQRAFAGELVKPAGVSATLSKRQLSPKARRHFHRVLLSAEIVHHLHAEPTFGQIKHQKVFHLCEHIAQLSDLEVQYHREAAGPYDNRLIYANEGDLKRNKWYEHVGHHYRPLAKAGGHEKYLADFSAEQLGVIHRLIKLMRTWDTKTCEILSTTYAAWNDLIIWKREPTETAIFHEILNRWHPGKRDIPEKRWHDAIAWMKKEGFVPTGFGRATAEPE